MYWVKEYTTLFSFYNTSIKLIIKHINCNYNEINIHGMQELSLKSYAKKNPESYVVSWLVWNGFGFIQLLDFDNARAMRINALSWWSTHHFEKKMSYDKICYISIENDLLDFD